MRRRPIAAWTIGLLLAMSSLVGCSSSADYLMQDCVRHDLGDRSVARVWDEVLLGAIRRDTPAPTVHARNLFHTSAAMWDAWAAFDPAADGYFVDEKLSADDVAAAREAAISYAAFRLLLWRYARGSGLQETFDELTATMESLCYRVDDTSTEGDSPAALGNRIAAAAIASGRHDGSLEDQDYVDTSYEPVNAPMIVADPGTELRDPDRWQPLALSEQIAQNGLPIPGNVQTFIGPHWGHVRSFALPPSARGTPIDPGPPPHLDDPQTRRAFQRAAIEVIRYSSWLDPADGEVMDIGPGAFGDNELGTNDGDGHDIDPATGEPYEPDRVPRADFGRVIAEYWADGPDSETPPGHWNVIANAVSDSPGMRYRVGGAGPEVDRLEWDVKLYFALNGAVHDAAVAAWGTKGFYDSVRPISMIRYMGERGQSTDQDGASYDPSGLPLVPGLVEVITSRSSARGHRHEALAGHAGEIAVRSWMDEPEDPSEASGVGWIRAVEWVPYQRATFVTPSFAGYVSGHSAFSRAAAEVLSAYTGSPYFPGGSFEREVPAGSLEFDDGPSEDVVLQWGTYFDAADQAGISRLYGGIHISVDDLRGRVMGAECGKGAWALAQRYFAGPPR